MINYGVKDLDAVLARLRKAGARVDDKIDSEENGRFGWAVDPEGQRFELWEPKPGH
jgi:predicted enzyme related to lactoylglutathione lyase